MSRRPFPSGAQDIGQWQNIFGITTKAAVVTNAALIVFLSGVLDGFSFEFRVWIFIGFQWALFVVQLLCEVWIPDVIFDVEIQQKRQDYLNAKIFEREVDDDDGEIKPFVGPKSIKGGEVDPTWLTFSDADIARRKKGDATWGIGGDAAEAVEEGKDSGLQYWGFNEQPSATA